MTLKLAIPNKGRLSERSVELLSKAGLDIGEDWGRKLYVNVKGRDIEVMLVRAQDIPEFVYSGAIDFGITGLDQVEESGYALENMLNLEFGYCRLSLAVPDGSHIKSGRDLKDGSRIATSFPKVTKRFFDSIDKNVDIIVISGAAEIMPYLGVADCIVDLVSTGSTLKMNRLRETEVLFQSQAAVVASSQALNEKKEAMLEVTEAIRSVIAAENRKYLMANVPRSMIAEVEKFLPGIGGPTVLEIAGNKDMVAVQAVVSYSQLYDAINNLRKIGATGILTLSMERLVE
ncbi:MAG: ATP phosphoribosyltransferase [Methanomassiliicoccaceae archaeon]|nr:ATP phosphoribosyltransferase [Methanomassiliicoccaceae archaeon]